MRKLLFSLALTLLGGGLSAAVFTPDWSGVKADENLSANTVWLRNPRAVAAVATEPKDGAAKLAVKVTPEGLEIDTRAFKEAYAKGKVVIRFQQVPFTEAHRLKDTFFELTATGTPGGLKGTLFFEGNQGAAKKHYWKAKPFVLGDSASKIRFEQSLPADLSSLHMRVDLADSGVYRLLQAEYGEVVAVAVDASRNYITNGGAEFGWYNTGTWGMNNLATSWDGKIYDGRGKISTAVMGAMLDREVKHSGAWSFRLEGGKDRAGRFSFNPVPFLAGKPASFSAWIKAEKPNTQIILSYFLASGIAYARSFKAGTEWKRYELEIPSWGGDFPGVSRVNDVVNGYGAIYKVAMPQITASSGAIWVDDAAHYLGKMSDPELPALSIHGKLTPARGYVSAGTPLEAELTLEALRPLPGAELKYEVVDFFGRKVAEAAPVKLDLQPGKTVVKTFTLKLPEALRGPFTWRFTAGGEKLNFYFGVNGPETLPVERLGINYDPRQNAETYIALAKDFRFGSVRMWSNYRETPWQGFRDIPYFKKNGFYVMMCVGLQGAAPRFQVPKDFSAWQADLAREAASVKGMVDAYEILNESNIWSGRTPVTEPEKYEEMTPAANVRVIAAARKALTGADPAVKIAGPATCHTDVNWTANVLKLGADKTLDIITEHPYRELPELPDYEDDLTSLRKVLDRCRPDYPVIASEAGGRSTRIFAEEEIPDYERKRTAYNTRMMLIGLANGLRQFHHFSLDLGDAGTTWDMSLMGNPGNGTLARPAPVMFALRSLADHIGDGRPAGRVRLGSNFRCYIFDRGDRRVAALWKWNGEAASCRPSAKLRKSLAVFDIMGNPVDSEQLTLNEWPLYLETALPAADFARLLAGMELGGNREILRPQLVVTGEREFGIEVRNLTGRALGGEVRILTPNVTAKPVAAFSDIPGEGSRVVTFAALSPITPADRPVEVEVAAAGTPAKRYTFNLKSILVPRLAAPPALDGTLAGWPEKAKFARIDRKNAVKNNHWVPALDNVAADLYLGWDDDYLYFAVVSDKAEYVENPIGVSRLWGGDGLQIAFDPLRNATPELGGYQDDDYEFSVGRVGGKPMVFMHCAAAAAHDSVDKALGVVPNVRSTIRVERGKTVYELAFPRLLVSPFRLQANAAMRFNVILNVSNGKERAGWLELAPGIGQTPKRPGSFIDLVLLP